MSMADDAQEAVDAAVAKLKALGPAAEELAAEKAAHAQTATALEAANASIQAYEQKFQAIRDRLMQATG